MKQFFKTIAVKAGAGTMRADIAKGLRISFAVAALASTLMACQTPRSANAQSEPVDSLQAADAFVGTKVNFDRYPNLSQKNADITKMVNDLWIKDPEYKEYVGIFLAAPEFSLGLADLNNDGVPEIFARHSDSDDGYCNDKGLCRLHIYTRTQKGLIEIGRTLSADPVLVSTKPSKGFRTIEMYGDDNQRHVYTWNGKTYRPK